jgi:hypothetical protein
MDVSLSMCNLKIECLCMHARKIYIIDLTMNMDLITTEVMTTNHFNEHVGFVCDYSLYVSPSLTTFLMYMCMCCWISFCIQLLACQFM